MAETAIENCNSNCETCGASCAARKTNPQDLIEKLNPASSVNKVIAVVSGKGGVGKSMVTSLLSLTMAKRGKNVGILDADITGPSIPQMFGIHEHAKGNGEVIFPALTKNNLQIMSINLLLEDEKQPVIWRGPILANVVKQFWTDVYWNEVNYMFVDMPPGTGDVPLTVLQSLPIDGIIVVASPQELVQMIVSKAVNMAKMMNVPILGLVENMSYFQCPDCGAQHKIFGESHIDETAKEYDLDVLAHLPLDPKVTALADSGNIEDWSADWLDHAADIIEKKTNLLDFPEA